MEDFITVPKMETRGLLSQNGGRLSSGGNVSASLLFRHAGNHQPFVISRRALAPVVTRSVFDCTS